MAGEHCSKGQVCGKAVTVAIHSCLLAKLKFTAGQTIRLRNVCQIGTTSAFPTMFAAQLSLQRSSSLVSSSCDLRVNLQLQVQ